jgi:hypothetical protein
MIYKIKLRSEVIFGHWQHWWLGGVDGVGSGEVASGWVGGVGSGTAPHWVHLGDPVLRTFYLK